MPRLIIDGPADLSGKVQVSGSKNAALPILAASLLVKDTVTLENVPEIKDVDALMSAMADLGASVSRDGNTVTINASNLTKFEPKEEIVKHMRASILLMGPLLARLKESRMAFPGGCVIGKRSVSAHEQALIDLGAKIENDVDCIHMRTDGLKSNPQLVLTQISVTATENAIMAAVTLPGITQIRLAAAEPHVVDLCNFLNSCGANIKGIGTHTLTIDGQPELHGTTHRIVPDYIEAGTWAIAGILTQKPIEVHGVIEDDLDSLWIKLISMGAKFSIKDNVFRAEPPFELNELRGPWLDTGIFPMFPTDLQAPFAVLLTQIPGVTKIFEKMFEGRLAYLFELEKMGARIEVLNPHQALVIGPSKLHGTSVASMDLRAGFAIVLASLIAEGKTEISNVNYIDRGYEKFEDKLRGLGVKVKRIEDEVRE